MKFMVDSEGDVEFAIQHCMELASLKGKKFVTLAFPSSGMYEIFLKNLHREMHFCGFNEDMEIEALIQIPNEKDDNDEELFGNR